MNKQNKKQTYRHKNQTGNYQVGGEPEKKISKLLKIKPGKSGIKMVIGRLF